MQTFLDKLQQKIVFNFTDNETVMDRVKNIMDYVHGLFRHDGDTTPKSLSPFDIIEAAEKGISMRCVEYSFLLTALLQAYAIPARIVGLKKKTVETDKEGAGHVVVEYWDKDYQKWIMCDPQENIIPVVDQIPLSCYELGLQISKFSDKRYANWIKDYLYYYDTAINPNFFITNDERLVERKMMLIPHGDPGPKIFQQRFPINAEYVTSVQEFYEKPLGN